MCDVCIIFNNLKGIERNTTLSDIPIDSLSDMLNDTFQNLKDQGTLEMRPRKCRVLKDFLSCLPYMLDKVCTSDNIIKGFMDVGMLDRKDKLWPDFFSLLKTKRQNISVSEISLIKSNFTELYNITVDKGHIPEDVYDRMGFPPDSVNGQIYERDYGVEREYMQRAKVITHEYQQELRRERERQNEIQLENAQIKGKGIG